MTRVLSALLTLGLILGSCKTNPSEFRNELRAPAYPLVTVDPYFSLWSMTDRLYDDHVRHWTTEEMPLVGAIRVDGEIYRFMGLDKLPLIPIAGMATVDAFWPARYTTTEPAKGWEQTDFDDRSWKEGKGSFGSKRETAVGTDLGFVEGGTTWVRREIVLDEDLEGRDLVLEYSHDDIFQLYVNGIEVARCDEDMREKNVQLTLPAEVVTTLKKGKNVIAAYVYNTEEFYLIDFGLYDRANEQAYFPRTARQTSVDVQATSTTYTFDCGPVELKLSFLAPLFMDDLDALSRPVSYIGYNVKAKDKKSHDVELYLEASRNLGLNYPYQESVASGYLKDGTVYLKTGSKEQDILGRKGDNVRIDWGYFYLTGQDQNDSYAVGDSREMRTDFMLEGKLSGDISEKSNANLALSRSFGNAKQASGKFLLGYDDIYAIRYFGHDLRGYWNRTGDKTIEDALSEADKAYPGLVKKGTEFDRELMENARKAGQKKYAELCALAYRQAISAHKLVESPRGELLMLSKENFSNGCIGTVDLTYPSSPLFLYYSPDLMKGLLNFIFDYCENGDWDKPFAPHDVGTYPIAEGEVYGPDMPVEESGNMIILCAAITKLENNGTYADRHWDILTRWAEYLAEKGLDPENQLCTDDFAGHLAHNANLSLKAIMSMASYGYMAAMTGRPEVAGHYTQLARDMAQQWIKMADDGSHYRLAFDRPDTWSMKYNLVWDILMGWDLFPSSVAEKEIAYYLSKMDRYGVPLDSRDTWTKADWTAWTATLSDNQTDFEALIGPLYAYMNEATDRVPMTDWYRTERNFRVGTQARSVIGGLFMPMLRDKMTE